jgi:preprotein translocase subunit SecG
MENVLLVAYLLIVLALIAVILLQRSEGGGLGMGSSNSGFMTARGSANLLTRTTAILATLFFVTAIGLTIISQVNRGSSGILDQAGSAEDGTTPTNVLDALNQLQGETTTDAPANPDAPDLALPTATPEAGTQGTVEAPAATDTPAVTETPATSESPAPAAETPAATPQSTAPADAVAPADGATPAQPVTGN